jgi:hypothetical protein
MDIEKVHKAVNIVDITREYPQLKGIHDLALRVLVKENEVATKELDEIIKKEVEEKRVADEKAATEAKAKAEKEAAANAVPPAKPQTNPQGAPANA